MPVWIGLYLHGMVSGFAFRKTGNVTGMIIKICKKNVIFWSVNNLG